MINNNLRNESFYTQNENYYNGYESLYNLSIAAERRLEIEYINNFNISYRNIAYNNGYWLQIYNNKIFENPYYSDYPIIITDIQHCINIFKKNEGIKIKNENNVIEIVEWKNNQIYNLVYYKFIYINREHLN